MYSLQPEKELNNRTLYCPRGKVQEQRLPINALIYVRGQRTTSTTGPAGNDGWAFEDVLPYYKRPRITSARQTAYHTCGWARAYYANMKTRRTLLWVVSRACAALAIRANAISTGASLEGAGIYDSYPGWAAGFRSRRAYCQPALDRTQLTMEHHCLVDRVLFDDHGKATGVSYRHDGERRQCNPAKEVILRPARWILPSCCKLQA